MKTSFTLSDYLFGPVKLAKYANPDKYRYSGYGFDALSDVSINGEFGKNLIIFGLDNSSLAHNDNRKKTS